MCYNKSKGVIVLEHNEHLEQEQVPEQVQTPEQEELPEQLKPEGYKPRPAWQVWAARLGLVLFIVFLILYYLIYFRGGQ